MKPILFNTDMVRATLEGRKTATRRVCKEIALCDFEWGLDREPYIGNYRTFTKVAKEKWDWVTLENVWLYNIQTKVDDYKTYLLKPKYQPGDILWVRETWRPSLAGGFYVYKADTGRDERNKALCKNDPSLKWRPSIHMPREAARIFLRVTGVRIERVQEITEDGAKREGIQSYWAEPHRDVTPFIGAAKELGADLCSTRRQAFEQKWDSIYSARGYGWEQNPWVWVIEFERVEKP